MDLKDSKGKIELKFGTKELKALDESVRNLFEMFSEEELNSWERGELNLVEAYDEKMNLKQKEEEEEFESSKATI